MKKPISLLLLICLVLSPAAASTPKNEDCVCPEFLRGVWVSSVANLDYPSKRGLSKNELKALADGIISTCLEVGFNAIFFQVRPCGDALYNSDIFPKSVFLTGESSFKKLDFDPLAYFVEKAHQNGIELHAWINPYRVTRLGEDEYLSFAPESPQRAHPEYLLKTDDGNYFFDPSLQEVRDLITAGVTEIIERYDVDGIHFDDYFYPDAIYDDSERFALSGQSDIAMWRVDNVNALVKQVHDAVKAKNPSLSFGISPRGVWANDFENAAGSATRGGGSLNTVYCDSLRFIREGWVDYICPQLYWSIGHSHADYAVLVPWWSEAVKGSGVKLYIGMADYLVSSADEDSPWYNGAELRRQLALNKTYPSVDGEVHFRYSSIASDPRLCELYSKEHTKSAPAKAPMAPNSEKLKKNILSLIKLMIFGASA